MLARPSSLLQRCNHLGAHLLKKKREMREFLHSKPNVRKKFRGQELKPKNMWDEKVAILIPLEPINLFSLTAFLITVFTVARVEDIVQKSHYL